MFDGLQEIRKSPLSAVTWLKSVLSLCTKQLAPSQITYRLQLNVLQKKKQTGNMFPCPSSLPLPVLQKSPVFVQKSTWTKSGHRK